MTHLKFYFCLIEIIMGLGNFFSKVGNGIKNFGLKAGSVIRNVAPKVLKIGGFVTNALPNVPGFIGTAAGVLNKGFNVANKVIDALPNSNFKHKLQDLSDKSQQKANEIHNKIEPTANKIKEYGDAGGKILNMATQNNK